MLNIPLRRKKHFLQQIINIFADTYASAYEGAVGNSKGATSEDNKRSLIADLNKITAVAALKPDKVMFDLALCFAKASGEKGQVGHDRSATGCAAGYAAENISYGDLNTLDVFMSLLIDEGVPSLGHRTNCLMGLTRVWVCRNSRM